MLTTQEPNAAFWQAMGERLTSEKTRLLIPGDTYRYHLINTGHSSARFGNCQVCGRHVSETWHQVEEMKYEPDQDELDWLKMLRIVPDGFWTSYQCTNLFGHRECLEKQQREAVEENTGALAPVGQ